MASPGDRKMWQLPLSSRDKLLHEERGQKEDLGPKASRQAPKVTVIRKQNRVQDGAICIAHVPGCAACAVLSMTSAVVLFN